MVALFFLGVDFFLGVATFFLLPEEPKTLVAFLPEERRVGVLVRFGHLVDLVDLVLALVFFLGEVVVNGGFHAVFNEVAFGLSAGRWSRKKKTNNGRELGEKVPSTTANLQRNL